MNDEEKNAYERGARDSLMALFHPLPEKDDIGAPTALRYRRTMPSERSSGPLSRMRRDRDEFVEAAVNELLGRL